MRYIKVLVQDNSGFERDFEDIQTSEGKFRVTFNQEQEVNEYVYNNLKDAIPIEWRQNRNERVFRKKAKPMYSIQTFGEWYEKDEKKSPVVTTVEQTEEKPIRRRRRRNVEAVAAEATV